MDRQQLFVFDRPESAVIFVHKLVATRPRMIDLAIFRDGASVIVLDGGDESRRERISALARISSSITFI
jgi:hypothetical protein